MIITGNQLIGYSKSNKSNETFIGSNTNERFYEVTKKEIDEAAQKANLAFNIYRNLSGVTKAMFLENIASEISVARPSLIDVTIRETGLTISRLNGELDRTINQIKLFASLLKEGSWVRAIIDTAKPDRLPQPKPDIRQMQRPLGAIAVFGASNFPYAFSVAGGDTISALAAGCPVLYKSHPGHPITSELMGEIIIKTAKEAGMPEGVFSLLQGAAHAAGTNLVTHPLIKAVAFTGSFSGGKALYDAAAKRAEPIPVYAEMGSVNPVFILPGIMEQKGAEIAKSLAASNTLSTGQFCTNPGIIISIESDETTKFLNNFSTFITDTSGDCMLTENIYQSYRKGIEKLSNMEGMKVVASGKMNEKEKAVSPYMFLTSADDFLSDKELHEEVFGPSSIHVIAKDKKELLEIADKINGQLTVSVWGTDNDLIGNEELLNYLELKAGRIICNGVPTGVEVTHAMMHGGPYPATTDSKFTSVGTTAIYRFTRPVCYQSYPKPLLPEALQNENPLKIRRQINGEYKNGPVE